MRVETGRLQQQLLIGRGQPQQNFPEAQDSCAHGLEHTSCCTARGDRVPTDGRLAAGYRALLAFDCHRCHAVGAECYRCQNRTAFRRFGGVIHILSDRNRSPLRAAVQAILGVVSCSTAAAVFAQANPPTPESLEEVVVTGYRQSLSVALDSKRASTDAIDAIVAEDIADFPDLNLAESIQRVPGVSIARDGGEGRQVSVRGLGPQFTRVRINGVEAMSANGSTDAAGGTNRGRNFDFNTFASELFSNLTVRKTATASTEEGSLGATVDLRTGRPFDFSGLTISGYAQIVYKDLDESAEPRAAFLISNTFADDKFGALLSVAYTDRNLADE